MLSVQNRLGKLEPSSTIGREQCEQHPDNQLLKELVAGSHANATYKRDLQVLESKGQFERNKSAEITRECNIAAGYWEYAKAFVDK
jgi:hypothetical protein